MSLGAEVLRLISEGESNKEIAPTLGLSVDTVKGQVKSILSKLAPAITRRRR